MGVIALLLVRISSTITRSPAARWTARHNDLGFDAEAAARRYKLHYGAAADAFNSDAGVIEEEMNPAAAQEAAKLAQERAAWLANRVASLRSIESAVAERLEAEEAAAAAARAELEAAALNKREQVAAMMAEGNYAGSMAAAQEQHRMEQAAATKPVLPPPSIPFDLASALALQLPIFKRDTTTGDALASVQVAEREWAQSRFDREEQNAGDDAVYAPKPSLLSDALHVTQSNAACAESDRFLIMRCPVPVRSETLPSNRAHNISPLIEWVRAMALAMSSRRTLMLDTSACDDSPRSSVCCNIPRLFKPVSPCVLDFQSLRPAARRRTLEAMDHWSLNGASPLVDAYGPSSIAFFHRSFSCHNGHSLWKTIPGATATTSQDEGAEGAAASVPPLSRVQIVRILARFALQPNSMYAAQLSLLPLALREQLNVQIARSGMVPPAWDAEIDSLPPFLSVYIPHALHLKNEVTIGKLQNAYLPRPPPSRSFSVGTGARERGGIHGTDPSVPPLSPMPSPFASKTISRYYTSSEYVDRIREEAAEQGFKIVVLWTHDHEDPEIVSRMGALSSNSSSPIVEEIRRRLPHLMIIDAKAVSAIALSRAIVGEPLLTLTASAHASLHTMFLLSSGSMMLGSQSNHAVRLVSFLMPSLSFGPSSEGAFSGAVHLPLADMDLDAGLYLTCWDSAFHTMRRDTLPSRVRMPPWGSPLGRILYPGVLPASAAPLSTEKEPTVPVILGNDEINVPVRRVIHPSSSRRVTLLLMVGFRATGLEQLDSFFNAHQVPSHQPLSRIMSEMFTYPQPQAVYLRAKRSFLDLLGREVTARLHDATAEPITEAQRQAGNGSEQFSRAFPGGSHAQRLDHVLPFSHTDLLPPPAPVLRLDYTFNNISTGVCKSKSMHHMDVSLLVQLLRDFAGSPISGGAVDIKVLVATRNVKAAALTGFKRIPPEPQPFLKPDWQYLWQLRVVRDQMAALDAELRSLHGAVTCIVDFEDVISRPEWSGRKLGAFLGWDHVLLKALPSPTLQFGYFAPRSYSFDAIPLATSTEQYEIQGMEGAIQKWFQREGQTLYSEPQPPPPPPVRGRAPPLPPAQSFTNLEVAINADFFPEWHGRSQAHLEFQSDSRRKSMANEVLIEEERRATAWTQQLRARNHGSGGSPSNTILDELLRMARSASPDLFQMLTRLQFPERGQIDIDCADPNLKLMVFSGGFNVSEMPEVYMDAGHSADKVKRMSLLDQCSLSGEFDLAAQVHALARTLSMALLTGRTLVVPHIPNTLSALLDLSALSSCTLESTNLRLNRVPTSEQGCRTTRAGQYFLSKSDAPSTVECSDIQPEISSDPFDSRQRVVAYTASEYAFQWLLLSTEASQSLPRTALLPTFIEKLAGVQEFVATLSGLVIQPNEVMNKHKTRSAQEAWPSSGGEEPRPAVGDVGILLPLQAPETVLSAHSLASSLLHQLDVWGAFARHASSPPLRVWVSHSCSRNSDLGSNGNSINIGRYRSMEYESFSFSEWMGAENKRKQAAPQSRRRARRLLEQSSMAMPPLLTRMHVNVQLQREFIAQYHMQAETRAAPSTGTGGPFSHVRWPRRTRPTAPSAPLGFSSVHERMLADVLADVLMQSETKWSVGAHAHEEGLLVAELRYFAATRKRQRSMLRDQNSGRDNRFFAAWGVRVSPPIIAPSVHDLYAQSYLAGLMRSEELHRQTLVYIGMYEAMGSQVAGVQPGATPYRMLPPALLSAPPSSPVLVPKRVFSSQLRFVFVAGIEGVGHHFFDHVLAHAREFNVSESSRNVRTKMDSWGRASMYQKGKSARSLVVMRHNGRQEHPQLRADGPLSDLFNSVAVQDGAMDFDKAKRQLETRIRFLRAKYDVGGTEVSGADAAPTVMFINLLNAGNAAMQSYPNWSGEDRSMHHPDLTTIARMFDDAGADLRVMVIVRSPGAAHASTIKRGHGDGIKEHVGTDINYMFQSRLLHDNAAIMEADLRALDPKFKLHLQLDRLSRYPVQHAQMISRFTGLHLRSLTHSLLQVSAGFHVKPASSWHQHSNSDQIAIIREHFAHFGTLDVSDGVQYVDGNLNGKHRTTTQEGEGIKSVLPMDAPAGEKDEEKLAVAVESRAVASVLSPPTGDALDSIVELRSCVSLSSLRPMLNTADRQSLPMRVVLHSLEGSGEPWLRWLLEQTTGIATGSIDAHSLAPWPASMYVPYTLLRQLPAWSLAGQTSVQSAPTCMSCLYEVSWDKEGWKPNIRIDRAWIPQTPAIPSATSPNAAQVMWAPGAPFAAPVSPPPPPPPSALTPLFEAPVGARIILLRNPLSLVFALATYYMSVHPYLAGENRMTVEGDYLDDKTRQAVEFARESVMKYALQIVREEYPKYIAAMGLLPEQQAGQTVGTNMKPSGLFKDTPLGAAAASHPATAAAAAAAAAAATAASAGGSSGSSSASAPLPTLLVHYEDLESHPVPVLRSILHFLGLHPRGRDWKCVTSMLREMERGDARPSPSNDGRTNSALLQWAASLLPGGTSFARFTSYYPWEWHVLLPESEYLSFRDELAPWIAYFQYEPEFDAMEALAKPIWRDEHVNNVGRDEMGLSPVQIGPAAPPPPPDSIPPLSGRMPEGWMEPPASLPRMRRSPRDQVPAAGGYSDAALRAMHRMNAPPGGDPVSHAERMAHLRALGLQADSHLNVPPQQQPPPPPPPSVIYTPVFAPPPPPPQQQPVIHMPIFTPEQHNAVVDAAVMQARARQEQVRLQMHPTVADGVANAREAFLRRHNFQGN